MEATPVADLGLPRVGVLGLGAMGLPIAVAIRKSGAPTVGVDIAESRVRLATEAGLETAATADALAGCDVVIVMVATPQQLADVAGSTFLTGTTRVSTVYVMSTVGPEAVVEFARRLQPASIEVVDAPVTGGVVGASAGTLTIFASGSSAAVGLAERVLRHVGVVRHCGQSVGDGQKVKLVNQLLATANLAVAAEALGFATAMNLDPSTALQLISEGAGSSWMLRDRGPRMVVAPELRDVGTFLSVLAKDAGLVSDAASEVGFSAPVLRAARAQYEKALAAGLGTQDDSALYDIYARSVSPVAHVATEPRGA